MTPPLFPAPDAIPVAWEWFRGLLMLLFPLHLLLMNAMLGFTAVSLYCILKGGETDRRLAHELAKGLPVVIAFAINFGVAALLFLQVIFGQPFYTSSVLMAVFWLGVPLLLLVAYYAAYVFDFRFHDLGKAVALPAALALALFFVIAFLFTSNMTLMLEPQRWTAYFRDPGGTLISGGGIVRWSRYAHFLTGGLAIGGLSVAVYGRWKARSDRPLGERAAAIGMHAFAMLTLLQLGIGAWFLLSLPRSVMLLFLGGDVTATALLSIGLALALAVLAAAFRRRVAWCAALAVPLVYVMSFLREAVRTGYLKPFFTPKTLPVVPEYSPMLVFAVALAVGTAAVVWMLRKTAEVYRDDD